MINKGYLQILKWRCTYLLILCPRKWVTLPIKSTGTCCLNLVLNPYISDAYNIINIKSKIKWWKIWDFFNQRICTQYLGMDLVRSV